MSTNKNTGIFQLENGYWGYHYVIKNHDKFKDKFDGIDLLFSKNFRIL